MELIIGEWQDVLLLSGLTTIVMQLFFFSIALYFRFDKVTDIAGSMNFVLIALLSYFLHPQYYVRQTVILAMVSVWGCRLGAYLLYRVIKRGKDERFDELRQSCVKFFAFWVYQMFWVFIVSLPVLFVHAASVDVPIGIMDYIGWALWTIGFVVEVWADTSKDLFMGRPGNRGRLLETGVWAWSRHPNYFGEICCWLGIFMSSASVFGDNSLYGWTSLLSPILTFFLLMLVSGVPLGERRYDDRYGAQAFYVDYKLRTAPLILFPPLLYRRMPQALKCLLCCEFPMYTSIDLDSPEVEEGVNAQGPSTEYTPADMPDIV